MNEIKDKFDVFDRDKMEKIRKTYDEDELRRMIALRNSYLDQSKKVKKIFGFMLG